MWERRGGWRLDALRTNHEHTRPWTTGIASPITPLSSSESPAESARGAAPIVSLGWPRSSGRRSVEANLNRVLSQSPNNARAHYCLGRVEVQTKRGPQGIAESERALALNPTLASAHALIGLAKLFDGHPEETESHELEALRVSPHDTEADVWVAYIALAKVYLGDHEAAPGQGTKPKLSDRTFHYGCHSNGVGATR
jgi:tetratricopeptide (TPR) repeat protein